jgi:type VI secretion system protein ImpH
MGPMPFYLTELVIYERDRRGPKPLGDFLDMLSQRQLQFFYRAWADSQPCAQADRPADDGFAAHLGAVSGAADLRFVSGDSRPDHAPDAFDAWARLGFAGHFAGLRSASAVADVLSVVLATPVRVVEGVGRWRDIPADTRTRLGAGVAIDGFNLLGLGATLGRRFFATEWDVLLVLAVRDMASLEALLPGGSRSRVLADCADAILPRHIEWSARIEIDEAAIAPARLRRGAGTARLGQTAWIAPRGQAGRKRDDLRLHSAA